jgi:hypothetical protein
LIGLLLTEADATLIKKNLEEKKNLDSPRLRLQRNARVDAVDAQPFHQDRLAAYESPERWDLPVGPTRWEDASHGGVRET